MEMRPFALACAFAAALTAQVRTGPAAGSAIPSFSAPDQNGREQSLATIYGPKGALIVFYRSADW
jgi:hypothetical protein